MEIVITSKISAHHLDGVFKTKIVEYEVELIQHGRTSSN